MGRSSGEGKHVEPYVELGEVTRSHDVRFDALHHNHDMTRSEITHPLRQRRLTLLA
jgi:hypothetical protein